MYVRDQREILKNTVYIKMFFRFVDDYLMIVKRTLF